MLKKFFLLIITPLIDLYHSFFNNDKGMSFRKLGAVFAMYAAYHLQLSILDDNIKKMVILAWMTFGAVCIGLVTIPDLIKFLNKKDSETEQPTT